MLDALTSAFVFLINTLADLYVFILVVRLILVYGHYDYYNPIAKLIAKLTDPLILPLKRIIPNFKGFELASALLIYLIEVVKYFVLGIIVLGPPDFSGLLLLAFAETMRLAVDVFFYAILLQVILSWFPYAYTDVYNLLALITKPIMHPIRRRIPPVAGFDISPIPALIGLQLIIILLIDPLYSLGMNLAFG